MPPSCGRGPNGGLEVRTPASRQHGGGRPRLSVDGETGDVGIGTTEPKGKLEVKGDWDGYHGALTLSGDKPTIRFSGGEKSGNQQWLIHGSEFGPGNLEFFNGGTEDKENMWGNPVMSLSPSGNVGIGTTEPRTQLEVEGAISAGRIIEINGYRIDAAKGLTPTITARQLSCGGPDFQRRPRLILGHRKVVSEFHDD